jgi:hypothetical protein
LAEPVAGGLVLTPRICGRWSLLTNRTRTAVAWMIPVSAPVSPLKTTQPASMPGVGLANLTLPRKGASSVPPPFTKPLPSTWSGPRRSWVTVTCTVPS